ncbi:MAG: hypothetical protein ACYTG6_04785 [Planctomycetota bacterium]|jgi:hypothetical protein
MRYETNTTGSWILALILGLSLAACTSGSSGGGQAATAGGEPRNAAAFVPLGEDEPTTPPPETRAPTGPRIRVTWEALSVERDLLENPRHGRRPQTGLLPNHKVVLVSESHPDAERTLQGITTEDTQGVSVATLPDEDMVLLLQGLGQRGFFQIAQSTAAAEGLFGSPNARGRVTVDRGDESWTLVSMRGQGLNPATKQIPALYSEAKQSIIMLRNQTPTMSVVTRGRAPMR